MRTGWISIVSLLSLALASCAPAQQTDGQDEDLATSQPLARASQEPLSTPFQEDTTEMTPTTLNDPDLQNLIERAKEDLSKRLSVSVSQINLIEAAEVAWPDAGLGCPQPGIDYDQVITPGYRITLGSQGTNFDYHTNQIATLILCNEKADPSLQTEITPSNPEIIPLDPEIAPSDAGTSPLGPVILGPDDQPPDPPSTPCVRGCPY